MSDVHEEQVPGVTLHLRKSEYAGTNADGLQVVVILDARVQDEELWKAVESKFREGFRVFTVPDFHIEVADVLRMELKETRTRAALLERELAQEKDARAQERKVTEALHSTLDSFGRALRNR